MTPRSFVFLLKHEGWPDNIRKQLLAIPLKTLNINSKCEKQLFIFKNLRDFLSYSLLYQTLSVWNSSYRYNKKKGQWFLLLLLSLEECGGGWHPICNTLRHLKPYVWFWSLQHNRQQHSLKTTPSSPVIEESYLNCATVPVYYLEGVPGIAKYGRLHCIRQGNTKIAHNPTVIDHM